MTFSFAKNSSAMEGDLRIRFGQFDQVLADGAELSTDDPREAAELRLLPYLDEVDAPEVTTDVAAQAQAVIDEAGRAATVEELAADAAPAADAVQSEAAKAAVPAAVESSDDNAAHAADGGSK